MRVLITGGAGFIGRHLAHSLRERDHEVVSTAHRTGSGDISLDLTDQGSVDALPGDIDVVVHLAALIAESEVFPNAALETNVVGTWRMLEYADRIGASAFVHGSTGGVYGSADQPFEEHDQVHPLDVYGLTKAMAELPVLHHRGDFRKVVLRYALPYGLGTPNPIEPIIRQVIAGAPVTVRDDGGPRINPLHISDAVAMTIAAITTEVSGTYNVAGTEVCTFEDVAQVAAGILGQEAVIDRRPREMMIPYYRSDIVAAAERGWDALGHRPQVSLRTGLAELVADLQSEVLRSTRSPGRNTPTDG